VAGDARGRLDDALDRDPTAGIVGPRVVDLRHPEHVLSAGERHTLPLLCIPRTLVRYRGPLDRPYVVSGIMGCAMLVTRDCFEAVGGFSEEIAVYYEDVDFCLWAYARGFRALVEPRAVVVHDGLRGFASGLTPWAAYLKARNPWLVVRRHGGTGALLAFVPLYAAMVASSAAAYALRGRGDVVRALVRGALAGMRTVAGAAPDVVRAPRADPWHADRARRAGGHRRRPRNLRARARGGARAPRGTRLRGLHRPAGALRRHRRRTRARPAGHDLPPGHVGPRPAARHGGGARCGALP